MSDDKIVHDSASNVNHPDFDDIRRKAITDELYDLFGANRIVANDLLPVLRHVWEYTQSLETQIVQLRERSTSEPVNQIKRDARTKAAWEKLDGIASAQRNYLVKLTLLDGDAKINVDIPDVIIQHGDDAVWAYITAKAEALYPGFVAVLTYYDADGAA